jgi:hypothetical protein
VQLRCCDAQYYVATHHSHAYLIGEINANPFRSRVKAMSDKKNKHKTLLELETGDCRWPVGDPRSDGFHFCGAPQMLGRPYCITHWPLSFVPSKGRQSASNTANNSTSTPAITGQVRRAA